MNKEQAYAAVVEPAGLEHERFRTRPFDYTEETLQHLFGYLDATTNEIEPFQLQVLCQHIERQVEQRQQAQDTASRIEVPPDYLGDKRQIEIIMRDLYRAAIDALPGRRIRREARRLCEFGLLTGDGYRESLGERTILEDYRLEPADLKVLVDQRILRREPRRKSYVYELSHDSLAGSIAHQRPLRFPKWLKYAGFVLLLLFLAGGFWAENQRQQAQAQRLLAEEIERVKQRIQEAAQQQLNTLLDKNSELQKLNEALSANLDELKQQTQRAADNNANLNQENADLREKLAAFQDQAELAVDQATRLARLENQQQLDKLQQSLATLKQQLNATKQQTQQQTSGVVEPEMVEIPAGKFLMGASEQHDKYRDISEIPQHNVLIPRPFLMGKYEVTFDEYDVFVLATKRELPDDAGWDRGKRPVINVTWQDAKDYAAWLSKRTGKPYRLPSEAEWEYAARAGSITAYPWGDEASHAQANYGKEMCCGGEKEGRDQWWITAPVGSFPTNGFGLHDMHGNVWEWVEDCWHNDYKGAPKDGSAWLEANGWNCEYRVVRGGSYRDDPQVLRSANRLWYEPSDNLTNLGFRLVQDLPQ